jgi:hypothetical protein
VSSSSYSIEGVVKRLRDMDRKDSKVLKSLRMEIPHSKVWLWGWSSG